MTAHPPLSADFAFVKNTTAKAAEKNPGFENDDRKYGPAGGPQTGVAGWVGIYERKPA